MKTGQIIQTVGFSATDGQARQLTVRERLLQIAMSKQSGDLLHPMLGLITITHEVAADLSSKYDNYHLIRLKRSMYEGC